LYQPNVSLATTSPKIVKNSSWFYNISKFRSKSFLDLNENKESIRMPIKKMKQRIANHSKDKRIEALYIPLKKNDRQMKSVAKKLAKKGNIQKLYKYFQSNIDNSSPNKFGSDRMNLNLSKKAFKLLNKKTFGDRFATTHYDLTINTRNLNKNPSLKKQFFKEIDPYFSSKQKKYLEEKINYELPINIDKELLPEFARKMIKKFTIFKGPNCFHAALAFQDKRFTNSARYNVKREKGYHRAMINYDELYRTLKAEFYEIDVAKSPLKYGDVIVFIDLPISKPRELNFKWIRHASTYLFSGYTFSKGSKSPNTPYTVKKLAEEWQTWDKYTSKLAVKVFRKSGKSVNKSPTRDLNSWLY
jgi:hypothetical protein